MRHKRKRRGSDRTQDGSDRTQDGDEEWDPAATHMEPSEGWWNRYGFKSFGEYLRYSQTGPDRPFSFDSTRKKKKEVPAPDLPAGGAPGRRSLTRTRQISIRLDEDGYQDLVKAARLYGVAPATMGRLLVAKGARKAVDAGRS